MTSAQLILDNDFELSPIDPRLFGGFAEHLGRHIYTGIFEPGHPTADEDGFRGDVIELVRELNVPIIRYPGGNFVSGYNWEDGVGPVESRPHRLELAWRVVEPNHFGTNEFIKWCKKVNSSPMMAINLGTRGPEDARNLLEYCNHPGGSEYSDLRKSHGVPDPYGIKLWCLGNEMDGSWQMGSKTAVEYGRVAREASKLMKWIDPTIETILCGSSGRGMSTFGTWEWEALHEASGHVEYLSLHTYYGNKDNNTPRFLSEPDQMDLFIEEAVALCDAVTATKKQKKKIHLSFDEWNVWYHSHDRDAKMDPWQIAPPQLEDDYTFEDALVVGGMLISLINHSDRVKIGCIAQLVNVIAPILTVPGGPAWRQTIFFPFAQASNLGRGTTLRIGGKLPQKDGRNLISMAAVRSEQGDRLTLFIVNRDLTDDVSLSLRLNGFGATSVTNYSVLKHDDLKARNTESAPNTVTPTTGHGAKIEGDALSVLLPPASWNVIELALR